MLCRSLIPDYMHPLGLSQLRIAFAFLGFLIIGMFLKNKHPFNTKDHIRLLICGLLGTSFNQLSFLEGLSLTSPVDASLICTCTPILTMLFASILIKEPITFKKAIGVAVGMSGAIVILYSSMNHSSSGETGSILGDLLVGVSCLVYSLYLVLVRPIMMRHSAIHVMKWIFFYGMLFTIPFCYDKLFFYQADTISYLPQGDIIPKLAFALIIGTIIPYMLVAFSLKLLRPTTVSMYNYLQPVITSIMAISIGQDVFTWNKPLAAVLIFAGVYLVITSKSKADIEKQIKV